MEYMTLDELARMVAEGFSSVDRRFEALEHRVETGFKDVNQRIDAAMGALEDHTRRIKNLELAAQ